MPWIGKIKHADPVEENRFYRLLYSLPHAVAMAAVFSGLLGCSAQIVSSNAATTTPTTPPSTPTIGPGAPPTTPPSTPPTAPPSTPPVTPPSAPPTTNPSSPPSTPPTTPPTTPPLAPPSAPSPGSSLPSEQASGAASLADTVGVATHLSYTDTPYYTDFSRIFNQLQSLGVHHIRDGYYAWPSSSPIVKAHQQLADIGIKCTYVIPFNTSTTSDAIENFAGMVGDVEALESPNECDDPGNCGATAQAGIQNAVAFLPTLSTAAKNLNVPLLGPSFIDPASYSATGNISSEITYNNLHVYFGGRNPGSTGWGDFDPQGNSYGSFAFWLDQAAIDGPGLPSVLTETGYMSYPSTTTPFTLPESVAASYVPRTLLLSYMHGIKRTHIYELLDEVSSPGYGLLHGDLSPKPAFNAVKNLLDLLADPGASGFTPGSLQYSISGGGASLNRLLLQKSDGSFLLVLWLEKSSWDAANAVPVAVAAQSITLNLTDSYFAATSYQFDTTGNSTPSTPSMDENSTSLSVTDQLTIVKIALR